MKISKNSEGIGWQKENSNTNTDEENIDLTSYAKKTDLPTKTSQLANDSGYLTEHQDISGKADKSEIPTKVSDLANDSNFISSIPKEYITETELNAKGFLTEIPSEYITETELTNKGYLTEHQNISGKADKSEIPTKTSQLTNDSGYLTSIPSEYITEEELNSKGLATETFVTNKISEASLNAEVIDARVGENGKSYASLGNRLNEVDSQLEHKVSNFQGNENVGKILVVDENGYLILDDMPEGTSYPVVGTVDENNVITLSSDKLADGLYTLRYSKADGYEEIGKLLVGEKIVTKITATKTKTSYEEGELLTTNDITVIAYYNDGTSSLVTEYDVDSSSVIMGTQGIYQLTISYINCTTNIIITVNKPVVATGNLFVSSTCTIGKRISSSGDIKDQANTFLTDFIEIGKCMSSGGINTIHWTGFHLYTTTSEDYTGTGLAVSTLGSAYRGVAYYDDSNNYLGQDSLYTTAKAYDSEGNYQLSLNSTYSTATKLRIFGATLPLVTSVTDLQNCKLTLNQLISEI